MIVTVKSNGWDGSWVMNFDLDYICRKAGKKEKDEDGKLYTPITIPHVKKIFKLIRRYYEDDIEIIDGFLKENHPKMFDIWKKVGA